MTTQSMIHHVAYCFDCERSCSARNAQAWAHNHARAFGHLVELQLAYNVRPDAGQARAGSGRQIDLEEAIAAAEAAS